MFNTLIVQPIFNLLLGLYSLIPGGDFGVTIVIFTILVRFALWPLVKKQLHQTKAMQKMQPELARIKKEAKGNKQVEGMMMMELYKRYDIHPFRSILVLFIQLPIFIALYQVIRILSLNRGEVANYTYDFLKGIGPIKDLIANPNNFNENFLGFINLADHAITTNPLVINVFLLILAVGSAILQYVMAKQTSPNKKSNRKLKDILNEAADGKQADQSEINAVMSSQMMYFLPVMMLFVMINLPGALVLYYVTSNIVAVIQQHKVLKKDTEEMIEIADKKPSMHKKATAKAREKEAREAEIVHHVVAKDSVYKKEKK